MSRRARGDDDAVARWVAAVNAAGRELDELAAAIHPSAWKDELEPGRERWKKLAHGGPQ